MPPLRSPGTGSLFKLGAASWLLCFQFFIIEQVSTLAWPGHYSMTRNYISDLGAVHCSGLPSAIAGSSGPVCSPWHALMNASFLLQGVLIVFGTIALLKAIQWSRWQQAAFALIALSGPGVAIVGLAPEDVAAHLHAAAAAEHFLCANAGMVLAGIASWLSIRHTPRTSPHAIHPPSPVTSLAAGVVGLAALVLFSQHKYLGIGVGGTERLFAYPLPLWLSGTGALWLWRMRSIPAAVREA